MKFFSVIVLLALCATVVTAAPRTTPNFSFEEYGLSNIFDGIGKKLKEFWGNVQCIRDVVGKAVKDSEVKGAWDETKATLDNLVNVEWKDCSENEDIAEQAQCKATVVEKGVEAISGFFKKLVAEAKWELVKEIKNEVVSECFENSATFFDLEEENDGADVYESIPEQFECIAEVLGDVSKANGLEDLWSKTEPQLTDRISKWKECPNAGNKFLVILCNLREGIATYKLVTDYIRLAATENPKVIQKFVREIQQRCAGQTYAHLMAEYATGDESKAGNGAAKIKCIFEAINDAVGETDFDKIWRQYKKDLEKLHERIKACKSEPSKWEAAKCVAKEVQRSHEILRKFFANLKNANDEAYERVKKYIKQRCFA